MNLPRWLSGEGGVGKAGHYVRRGRGKRKDPDEAHVSAMPRFGAEGVPDKETAPKTGCRAACLQDKMHDTCFGSREAL